MIRLEVFSAVAVLVLGMASLSTGGLAKKPCLFGKCSYIGDPHLIPFASSYGGPQGQYWCQNPGWELFVSNSYVSIYVLVGTAPYWIIDYILIFHNALPCVIIGSSTSPPLCASGTPAISSTLSAGASWIHTHTSQCIIVHIEKWSSFYNVHIYQSYALINFSTGLCRKWNCKKEVAWTKPLPIIPELCNIFINVAKQRAMGDIEPNLIDMAYISCVNDMQMTFDPKVAITALSLVLHDSAEAQLDCNDTKGLFEKADALKREAVWNATKQANDLISNTKQVCNEQQQCLKPIRAVDK